MMNNSKIKVLTPTNGIQQYFYAADEQNEGSSLENVKAHFLHGTGFHSATLFPLASHLPQGSNFLFSDLPGHGGSFKPDMKSMPNWPLMAEQIGSVLELQIKEPIVGIGHSFGGALTLYMAVKFPHLFKQVIVMDPIMFPPWGLAAMKLMRSLGLWRYTKLVSKTLSRADTWANKASFHEYLSSKRLYKNWHSEVLELFVEHGVYENTQNQVQLCCDPKWEGQIFGSYPQGLWEMIEQISQPTTIIQPKNSFPLVPKAIELAAKCNSNIEVVAFGHEHCFPMEHPRESALKLQKIMNL